MTGSETGQPGKRHRQRSIIKKDNTILTFLKDYAPNQIYFMAPKNHVQKGYQYYRENKLSHLVWNDDFSALIAKVWGARLYSVVIFIKKEKLDYSCDCPASSGYLICKHIICSLFTIKNLLFPHLFNIGQRPEYRKSLISSLLNHNEIKVSEKKQAKSGKEEKYSIIIEKKDYGLHYFVQKDDKKVSVYSGSVPSRLRKLTQYQDYYYRSSSREVFMEYLKTHKNLYPLLLKTGNEFTPLKWDKAEDNVCTTELNASNNMISLKRLLHSHNNECKKFYLLGDMFAADLESNRLIHLKNSDGWYLWNYYNGMIDHGGEYLGSFEYDDDFMDEMDSGENYMCGSNHIANIPVKNFQNVQLSYKTDVRKAFQQYLIFKVNNETSPPKEAEYTYALTIEPGDSGDFILRTECHIGVDKTAPNVTFFNYFKDLKNDRYISGRLRAKKRRAVLYKAMIKLLPVNKKSAANKIIKEALEDHTIFPRSIRTEAKRYLSEYFEYLLTDEERLQYAGAQWFTIKNDKKKEGLLYSIPYNIFGWEIFKGMTGHNEMTLPAKILHDKLPDLFHRCREHSVKLFFKGKPLVSSSWDFSFDAVRTSGIDWFEIKPEIQCDGDSVSADEWQMAIAGKGVIEKNDCIQILDSNSQKILTAISSIVPTGEAQAEKTKEIVKVPGLAILDWISLRKQGVRIKLPPEDEAVIERLTNFTKIKEKRLPKKLKAKLRPYQKSGYDWLSFLYEHRFGSCLADDMGLGKTVQAIALMGGIREKIVKAPVKGIKNPHLIVVPPSLLFNWESEIEKFYPDFKIHFYTGKDRNTAFKRCHVVLTTYGIIRRDIEKLKDIDFHLIIFDEAQAIKNIFAETTGAVRQLKGYFKLSLTGTPLENHLGEYYSILDLCLPGLLGEYNSFKSQMKLEHSPILDMIIQRTGPFVLRRTKDKVLKELPKKTETDIYLELNSKQKTLYQKTVEMVKHTINDAYTNKTRQQAQIIALTALLKLRQICVSPRLIVPDIAEPSPKIDFLINKLNELLDEGHSALVFSQFTSFLDILEKELTANNIIFSRLDGSTPTPKRKKLVEEFQNGNEASIFLLSLKAGGQGLNLTKASYVFHLDPWWNPAVENQASDRAHRIGQKNKVSIMRILMRHTIEEKMMDLKKKKFALYKAVMENSSKSKRGFSVSKTDFEFLLR